MGLELLSANPKDWIDTIQSLVNDKDEVCRRETTQERVCLYRDDYRLSLEKIIDNVFVHAQVRQRLKSLVPLVGGTSFIKRVADELARPLYARAPVRKFADGTPEEGEALALLGEKLEINSRMDDVARLLVAANSVFALCRYVEGFGLRLDVLTGADVWVIPHPSVPTAPLAIIYERASRYDPGVTERVIWDDTRYFALDVEGRPASNIIEHNLGCLPIVDIHQKGRTTEYWDEYKGMDLVSQTKNSMFYDLMVLKKTKAQSHIQLTFSGDSTGFSKDQVSDDESVLISNGAGQINTLNLESDPSKIIAAKKANEDLVKSNYGLVAEDDTGLKARVAELASVLVPAEQRIYKVFQKVSQVDTELAGSLPDNRKLIVDLGTIHHRVDRETQLRIRETEAKRGYRSGVDDVLEDNPELGGDRELALRWIDERMKEEAVIILRRRALNIPEDGSVGSPGQNPEDNGKLGPAVRDGVISKDQASEIATKGKTQSEEQSQ
jgi:hypothetical protein